MSLSLGPVLRYSQWYKRVNEPWSFLSQSCCTVPVFDPQDELMEPVHVLKAGLVSDGKDDEEAVPRPHVLLPHGAELLLACRVQHWGEANPSVLYPNFSISIFRFKLHLSRSLNVTHLRVANDFFPFAPSPGGPFRWSNPSMEALGDIFTVLLPNHGFKPMTS